jgi:hypothetical protein
MDGEPRVLLRHNRDGGRLLDGGQEVPPREES